MRSTAVANRTGAPRVAGYGMREYRYYRWYACSAYCCRPPHAGRL